MISHEEIKGLVAEWGLREDVIEKDYVIGWVLWGLGSIYLGESMDLHNHF